MDELLTVREVSGILKIDYHTIQQWFRSGKLPGVKIGKAYRIKSSDLTNWFESKKREAVQ